MKNKFSLDGIIILTIYFIVALTVITWVETISQVLDMPKLVEWSWIFIALFCLVGVTGLLYLFKDKGRRFGLIVLFFSLFLLIGSVFVFQTVGPN